MKTFKQYLQSKRTLEPTIVESIIVVETTVPDHLQHISENWDHHSEISSETHDKMDKAMGGMGKSFTTFPLVGHNHNDIDPDVAEHLTKHNYQVKDYTKGIATIKKQVGDPSKGIPLREKMVDEKIGSILDKTGATPDVKKSFINDPARTATKNFGAGTQHVVITHSPLGVSGMSTGTSWANQSCMDQGRSTGYNDKLRDDSEHGTHVAYLVHHNDHNGMKYGTPDNPIARIAIKPYHEEENDHESDTIFRPENKMYGSGNTHFERAVGNWATEHYPAKAGLEYTKNKHVYDDTGNDKYQSITKEDVEDDINHGRASTNTGGTLDKDVIDHAMSYGQKHVTDDHKHGKSGFVQNMAQIGNLNTQHVAALHKMAGDDRSALQALAVHHGDKFSTNAIKKHADTFGSDSMTNRILMSTKLPSEVVDDLPVHKYSAVRKSLLKPKHYDKLVDTYVNTPNNSGASLRDHVQSLSKENIDTLANMTTHRGKSTGLSEGRDAPHGVIMSSPHFNQEHHDKIVSSSGLPSSQANFSDKNNILLQSKFSKVSDVGKLNPESGLSTLASNPHISKDTAITIKNHFIGSASLGTAKEHGGVYNINGFSRGSIPTQISKHLTEEDHATLADSGKDISFAHPDHSEKHLNAIKKNIDSVDNALTHHIETQTKHHEANDLDEFDPEDDDHSKHLQEKLHSHVENYARAIDNHIDNHVSDGGRSEETIKDYDHHEKIQDHLDKLDKLDNYKTESNSHRFEHEHFDDHVADIHDRMKRLTDNTEYRDNHGDW